MFVINNFLQIDEAHRCSDVNETLRKIKQHFDALCVEDLPFYIGVIFRFHLSEDIYQSDDLKTFISICLDKIESLEPKEIAQSFNSFLKRCMTY